LEQGHTHAPVDCARVTPILSLTPSLRGLERDGYPTRTAFPSIPPRVIATPSVTFVK
jgi:hypothetical protein